MICPKCGTTNGNSNKFCRECGVRLDLILSHEERDDAGHDHDEVRLGEHLFEVMKLYESGDLDTALTGIKRILRDHPGSASAHSIQALIYERKAEFEFGSGDLQAGNEFLQLALFQYEKIIDLNPDSVADREKLAALRVRIAGGTVAAPPPSKPLPTAAILEVAREKISAMPTPILAGSAAFLVCLVLALVLIPGGKKPAGKASVKSADSINPKLHITATPGAPSPMSGPNGSSGLRVYTFPTPTSAPQRPATTVATSAPERSMPTAEASPRRELEPVKLPPLGAELTIVPEPKRSKASVSAQPKSGDSSSSKTPAEQPRRDESSAQADGSTVLANAIELRNQGRTSEAVSTAQQAISLFQADVDAGRNTNVARRGIENARKLITLWQQTGTPNE